ncbi:MAG: hypothetical protein KKB31_02510 [Nanoarchaeota archaeon]|nr:hypothetical protein [Nanoarchaeota archaeon]
MNKTDKKHAPLSEDRIRVLDALCRTTMSSADIAERVRVTPMFVDSHRPTVHVKKADLWKRPSYFAD